MRIAHVISSLKRGGAEVVLASLLNHSTFETDEHYVMYFHDGPLVEQLRKKNIQLFHIPYGIFFPFRFLYRLYATQPDVIHALLWFSIVCSALSNILLRIPVVGIFHNNIEQNSTYKNYIDWIVLRLVTRYGAVSQAVAEGVCTYHTWLDRSRIIILQNGIDVPPNSTLPQRNMYALPDNAMVIGTVGRFESVKRYPWLIDRFTQLCKNHPDLYLLLIGTGTQEQMLRDYVKEKNVDKNVRFIVNQNAYTLYPLCDIFTLTSKKEGISIALLEAMSYGKCAVITHEGDGHPVITHGYDGFVVPADDPALFCAYIEQLIADRSLRDRLGQNALQTVTHRFSRDTMAKQYKILFTNLLFTP